MPKQFSTGISPEQHHELMVSQDAREERRQEILAQLPVGPGMIIRGRSRDFTQSLYPPMPLSDGLIEDLGLRFQKIGGIITSKFTENIPVLESREKYETYVTGGNRNNKRYETDPLEKKQANLARQRQTQHVSDRLHRETWLEWQTSKVLGAATSRVKRDIKLGRTLNETAAHISAAALEDFGHSLLESDSYREIHNGGIIARRIIETALHGAEDHSILAANPPVLFLLVQREQERREQLWGDMLDLYEQDEWGGNRRSSNDISDEQVNQELIVSLNAS